MMREHFVEVPDGALFAVEVGRGQPLIMLHGWPLDHRMFNFQLQELARHFRVVAIDRRGFGRSTAPANMSRELDDIDRLIEQLDLGRVHLLGVSQGGRVALRYAATRPERLRSLLLQGAVVDGLDVPEPESEHVPIEHYANLARGGRLKEVIEHWLRHPMMLLPESSITEQHLLNVIVADYSGMDLVNYDPQHYQFDEDVVTKLNASALPVLLLTGTLETEARKAHAKEILNRVVNSHEIIFAASGHLSNLTEPEAFNRAVTDFCRANDRNVA
jgi:pimeloyl-ACP methyl ester carboxylesterase